MSSTVARKWNRFEPVQMTEAEFEELKKDKRHLTLVYRVKRSTLHPVTTNEWAYRKLAELRGQEWPRHTPTLAAERGAT